MSANLHQQGLQGAEIGTLRPLASIRLKIENSWCDSRGCRVQKLQKLPKSSIHISMPKSQARAPEASLSPPITSLLALGALCCGALCCAVLCAVLCAVCYGGVSAPRATMEIKANNPNMYAGQVDNKLVPQVLRAMGETGNTYCTCRTIAHHTMDEEEPKN